MAAVAMSRHAEPVDRATTGDRRPERLSGRLSKRATPTEKSAPLQVLFLEPESGLEPLTPCLQDARARSEAIAATHRLPVDPERQPGIGMAHLVHHHARV